jgi:putative photosynthetic complex assembly protein 2
MGYLSAICFALVLWWVSTGLIIVLYRQPRWTYDATFGLLSVLAAGCATLLFLLRNDTSITATYLSFSAGTLLWGWNLASYYTGAISGRPIVIPSAPLSAPQRFRLAVRSGLYHELVSLGMVVMALWWSIGVANTSGQFTIVLFYVMHQLSKLNIYFGARNFSGEWLPEHLRYIMVFFGPTRNHWFFGVTISVALGITLWTIVSARAAVDPATQIQMTFLALLAGAAVLEILVLMIPPAYLHRSLAFLTHLSVAANTKSR